MGPDAINVQPLTFFYEFTIKIVLFMQEIFYLIGQLNSNAHTGLFSCLKKECVLNRVL